MKKKSDSPVCYFVLACVFILLGLTVNTPVAFGQSSEEELAKKLTNPVADLVSLPIQFNYDRDIGNTDGKRLTTNIQPVIPFDLNDDWLVISRTILPVVTQSDVPSDSEDITGLGDTVQSFFFSPKENIPFGDTGSLILGGGGVFLLPTATDSKLGTKKWGAGPTAVGLVQDGPWSTGALVNHIWSFAGDSDRPDVNQTYINPFVSYTTKTAWTFTPVIDATYDWEREDWSIPVSFMTSKVLTVGKQPISIAAGPRYWMESTDNGPDGWGARVTVNFLFPKK